MARCEATIGVVRSEWGFRPQRCHQHVGLRVLTDEHGVDHWYCTAPGHLRELVRRFGVDAPKAVR